jgi:hypothetical protein
LEKRQFTGRLVDGAGVVYKAYIPLDKTLVCDDSTILLVIEGEYETEFFRGRVLRGV